MRFISLFLFVLVAIILMNWLVVFIQGDPSRVWETTDFVLLGLSISIATWLFVFDARKKARKEEAVQRKLEKEKAVRARELEQEGIEAAAIVKQANKTGRIRGEDGSCFEIATTIIVPKPDGSSFTTTSKVFVTALEAPQYQPGKKVRLLYHPSNPLSHNEIIGPAVRMPDTRNENDFR